MPLLTAADTIRILIATDSHVGFEERDPVRGNDSGNGFEEVMELAKSQDVDMVLLAGDLFHDNKPSRKSMYTVMRALRKNCLGDKPCELEWLSDANEVFGGAFGHVNYEDPDINVSIPVFSIHGNHDDPTGDGNYCSLDLLQVSGLLNYFGRTPESDKIDIKPVLLQKGQTKLALYGMSNVRDERLFRTFRDHKVRFYKPGMQQKDWFNLMAVHQNHHAHTETGYLPENFLPEFMDLVVWGHEHECLIDPRLNPEMTFHVMQPGSSVATSLVPGEAVPKHVAIVSVSGKDFKVEKHRIRSVRPFVTREIVLANDHRFRGLAKAKDNRARVTAKLVEVVKELIEEAKAEWLAVQVATEDGELPTEVPLPLVRLKVEYTALEGGKFECENPQRFSQRFVNQVANTSDVVQFYRKKVGGSKKSKVEKDMPDEDALASMATENVKIGTIVGEYLNAQSLKIIPQAPFGEAVTDFIKNDDKWILSSFLEDSLANSVKELLLLDNEDEEDIDIDAAMEGVRAKIEADYASGVRKRKKGAKLKPRPEDWDSMDGEWEDDPTAWDFEAGTEAGADDASNHDDLLVDSVDSIKKKPAAKRAPAKPRPPAKARAAPKAAAKGRGRKKVIELSVDEDDAEMLDAPPPPKSQPKRVAATRGRQTQLDFSQSQAKSMAAAAKELSDDEISDDDAFEPMASSSRRR